MRAEKGGPWFCPALRMDDRVPADTVPNFLSCCSHLFLLRLKGTRKAGIKGIGLGTHLPLRCPSDPFFSAGYPSWLMRGRS